MTTDSRIQAFEELVSHLKEQLKVNEEKGGTDRNFTVYGSSDVSHFSLTEKINDVFVMRVEFHYEPPVEAPPAGSIVEVWQQREEHRWIAYSCGGLTNGQLYVNDKHAKAISGEAEYHMPNWRVIKEAGEI